MRGKYKGFNNKRLTAPEIKGVAPVEKPVLNPKELTDLLSLHTIRIEKDLLARVQKHEGEEISLDSIISEINKLEELWESLSNKITKDDTRRVFLSRLKLEILSKQIPPKEAVKIFYAIRILQEQSKV